MPGNRPALADEDASPGAATRLMQAAGTADAPVLRPAPGFAARPTAQAGSSAATATARPRAAPTGKRRGTALLRLISPVVVLLLWQLVSGLGLISSQRLPPPTRSGQRRSPW